MTYGLGVDIGTTFTAAAVRRRDGLVEMVSLGTSGFTIPSAVFVADDGTFHVGDAALARGLDNPSRLAREFKRRLGDPVPYMLGGSAYSVDRLTGELLGWVLAVVGDRYGGPPDEVVVTHPANWGPFKLDILASALAHAGVDDARMITEPEAAALHYASTERVEPGQTVAVYDLGGGTFDAAVLERTTTGFDLRGQPRGIERLGGIDFDHVVRSMVEELVDGVFPDPDGDDPALLADLADLHSKCQRAKITLSADTTATVRVRVGTLSTDVRLTRAEFEARVEPTLAPTIDALRDAVASADLDMHALSRVLLVGGSSRIPLISPMVATATGRDISIDVDPKAAVALGAAATTLTDTADEPVRMSALDTDDYDRDTDDKPIDDPDPPEPVEDNTGTPDPPLEPRRNRRRWIAAALAAAVLAGITAIGLGIWDRDPAETTATAADDDTGTTETTETETTEGTTTSTPARTIEVVNTIQVGSQPRGPNATARTLTPVAADGLIWAPNSQDGTVAVVDIATQTVTDTITVGAFPQTPLTTDGLIWVPNASDGTVTVIDIATRTVTDTITVGEGPGTPIEAGGHIWIPNTFADTVSVIDIATRTVTDTITVGNNPQTPVEADGHIWVSSDGGGGTVTVIDTATRTVTDTITVGEKPRTPVQADGHIWVVNSNDGTVTVIDSATRTVTDTIAVGTTPRAPEAADGRIWVPDNDGTSSDTDTDSVVVIDTATNTVTDTIEVGDSPLTPIEADGRIWVAHDGGTVTVIDAATQTLTDTIEVGSGPGTPVATDGLIWVPDFFGGTLTVLALG